MFTRLFEKGLAGGASVQRAAQERIRSLPRHLVDRGGSAPDEAQTGSALPPGGRKAGCSRHQPQQLSHRTWQPAVQRLEYGGCSFLGQHYVT